MRSTAAALVSDFFFNSTFFASDLPVACFSTRPDAGLPLAILVPADFLDAADFFVTIGSPVFVVIYPSFHTAAAAARALPRTPHGRTPMIVQPHRLRRRARLRQDEGGRSALNRRRADPPVLPAYRTARQRTRTPWTSARTVEAIEPRPLTGEADQDFTDGKLPVGSEC
jgi:hypothetical protein